MPLGLVATPAPARAPAADPLDELERLVLPALQRSPCVVAFSGGRDSSAILAVAVRAARRHGLPDPVAVSLDHPEAPEAEETEFQRAVLDHLGVRSWERVRTDGPLDQLGPEARAFVERHGPRFPANAWLFAPMLRFAAGGALLTGIGGDDIFGGWRWQRAAGLLARRERLRPATLGTLALAASPLRVRTSLERRRGSHTMRWLRPEAETAFRAAAFADRAAEPRRWDARVPWQASRRIVAFQRATLQALAADHAVTLETPLVDPSFAASLGTAGGRLGWGTRTETMRALFSELLPDAVLGRVGKASYGAIWRGPETLAFAERWDGSGVPADLVDVDALRRVWKHGPPDARTGILLHRAWLDLDKRTMGKEDSGS